MKTQQEAFVQTRQRPPQNATLVPANNQVNPVKKTRQTSDHGFQLQRAVSACPLDTIYNPSCSSFPCGNLRSCWWRTHPQLATFIRTPSPSGRQPPRSESSCMLEESATSKLKFCDFSHELLFFSDDLLQEIFHAQHAHHLHRGGS